MEWNSLYLWGIYDGTHPEKKLNQAIQAKLVEAKGQQFVIGVFPTLDGRSPATCQLFTRCLSKLAWHHYSVYMYARMYMNV